MRALRLSWIAVVLVVVSFAVNGWAQQRVDSRNTHERLLCVVPMVGAGTSEDPRRPQFVPVAPMPETASEAVSSRQGILAYAFQESDDGQWALVEFVAANRQAFKEILDEAKVKPDLKTFEKGKAKRSDIEKEFRKHKKDFDLDSLGVRLP
ncbi:MAG: hypothetical protein L0387_05135 [Acidobacteria bacterium]|nr:hypothetical protein [Acidobacteriota bacterium]MCI0724100.1 hypothetical protein [Acidobacteriota bacterium]